MLRSLRFQLPALFLLAVVIAGLVSAAIALRLLELETLATARGVRPALLVDDIFAEHRDLRVVVIVAG